MVAIIAHSAVPLKLRNLQWILTKNCDGFFIPISYGSLELYHVVFCEVFRFFAEFSSIEVKELMMDHHQTL